MASRAGQLEAVKVVFIQTHYVETDPMSFKSVVQSLTGKDSSVAAWTENEQYAVVVGQKRSRITRPAAVTNTTTTTTTTTTTCGGGGGGNYKSVPALMKETSFKECERLMLEFPSMDELLQFVG